MTPVLKAAVFSDTHSNTALMIEAIPINSECIVLIITKVDDPEELDPAVPQAGGKPHTDPAKSPQL